MAYSPLGRGFLTGAITSRDKLDSSDIIAEVNVDVRKSAAPKRSPVSVGVGGSTGSYGSGLGVGLGFDLGALGNKDSVDTTLNVRLIRRSDNLAVVAVRARTLPLPPGAGAFQGLTLRFRPCHWLGPPL